MPIHRGSRLTDLISRLPYAQFVRPNIYQTWPNLGPGPNMTSGSTQRTYGSWYEIVPVASAPNVRFTVTHACWNTQEGRGIYLQIGTGSAGSEVPVAMARSWGYGYEHGRNITSVFPLAVIPGGTRVAIRFWSDYTSGGGPGTDAINGVYARLVTCRLPPATDQLSILRLANKVSYAYPGDAATAALTWRGATSNATAWTYGTWTEYFNATAESRALIITDMMQAFLNNPAEVQGQTAYAYGASGSETTWGEFPYDFYRTTYPNAYGAAVLSPFHLPFPVILPGSTRMAARAADSVGGFGLYWSAPLMLPGNFIP